MGGCRCSYKTCKSATKTTENLHFFHFPVKHRDRCAVWIRNAERPEFIDMPDYQLRNKVVCGLHFEDRYFANIEKRRLVHNAIPTLDEGCDLYSDDVMLYAKDMDIFPTSTDGTTFSMRLSPMKLSQMPGERIVVQKGGLIIEQVTSPSEPDVYTIDPSYFDQSFHSITKLKEVIINSASVKKEEPDEYVSDEEMVAERDREDDSCLLLFDHDEAPEKSANQTNGQGLNFFFDDDELEEVEKGEDQTPSINLHEKAHIMVQDINESTNASSVSPSSLEMRRHSPVLKKCVERNVMRRINSHALEIANIKRSLAAPSRITNKHLLRILRGRLPDSLLGAVSLHLHKRSSVVTREEVHYERVIRALAPSARLVFQNSGWRVPGFNNVLSKVAS